MNNLKSILIKYYSNIKTIFSNIYSLSHKFYDKSHFLCNKQKTIEKMYEPIINEKVNTNKNLLLSLDKYKLQNKAVESEIKYLKKENAEFKVKITLLQEMLTNNQQ
ncbi:hypothetical protein ACFIJ5_04115 [Haloimpatiens sp. FM7330]|uniref:hypothetical protein n=1 Tax=Haloimpatiens sp. FM7330 TaxID=3298610 RepID=UPI00363FB74C